MLKGVYLTLMVGPVVPLPVPQVVVDVLTSVQVTSAAGQRGGFQLQFALNNMSPLHTAFLITAGQTPLLRTIIILTINGVPDVLMDGVVTRAEVTPGSKPGQSTLTVTGEDLTRLMDQHEMNGFPYPAMPVEARIYAIIAKYAVFGIAPLVVPTIFKDVSIPIEKIPSQQGTDLKYIEQLASQAGYVFYIEPGPLPGGNIAYWGPEIKVGVPQPALNLDMDALSNVESLNFTFNSAGSTMPVILIHNKQTKLTIPVAIPAINPLQPPLGLISASISGMKILDDTAKLSPIEAISRGIAAAAESKDTVSGSGSLDVTRYGRLLKSRRLVGVRGAGMAFDGLYFVKSVTTSIKRNELKQSFNLTRNGLISITPRVPV